MSRRLSIGDYHAGPFCGERVFSFGNLTDEELDKELKEIYGDDWKSDS